MKKLTLLIECSTPPPAKSLWHLEDASSRQDWNHIFEAVTTWFCASNSFRKTYTCVIIINEYMIEMKGETLRYLAPGLRSAASLIHKAYKLAYKLEQNQIIESTPGIFVSRGISHNLGGPFYHLKLENNIMSSISDIPNCGVITNNYQSEAKSLNVPASTLSQAIIWINYN